MIKFEDPPGWLNARINGVKKAYIIPDEFNGNGIAVDIGANVGGFPIVNHTRFGNIYCFEPSEYGFNECVKNTKDYGNVFVFKNAVSNKSGEKLKLMAFPDGNYSGNASVVKDYRWDENNYEMVDSITIEDIYDILGSTHIDYLKMDCEGGEYNILMNKDLSDIDYIAIEVHIQLYEKATELINYLKERFDVISELNDGVTMHKEFTFKRKLM